MNNSSLQGFESTFQKTNVWINVVREELAWDDSHKAYRALRATLQALRDRLPVAEVADLGAQLPMLVRGFYYEGWRPAGRVVRERRLDQFLQHIRTEFDREPDLDPEEVVRAVFRVLSRHVTEGEIHDVRRALPKAIRELWA